MRQNNRHRRTRNGITLLLTVMSSAVILPMVGLAIDTSLLYAVKAKLQAAVDAAALSGARSLNRGMDISSQEESARTTAQSFFNANFPSGHLGATNRGVTIEVAESAYRTRTVRADGSVDAPAYFMRMLGFRSTHLTASGMASRRDVNLVLVLDRSFSMGGAMGPMRSAARAFVDKFAEGRDNVGLIVFGGSSILAFPNPSPSGPSSNFKSASPNVDTLISQTVNGGSTGTAQSLWLAYQELVKRNEAGALNLIVFFTDGLPNGVMAEYNDPAASNNLLKTSSACTYRLVAGRPMFGFVSQASSGAPTGNTLGIQKPASSTLSSVDEGPIQTNSQGCAYRTNYYNVRQDVARMPTQDCYGNATTGYISVDLTRLDSPQHIARASLNAADSAVQRIRQDSGLNVVIYTIGYEGGAERPDETWMRRISNDPGSPSFDSLRPPGLYVRAPTTGDLAAAFAKVASEILRLAL
jgi:Flp pilus assembly protein TadG